MSTLRTNTLQDAAGNNSVPMATVAAGTAKAWVNFNGTGVVAIRASFNVNSITDNGVGDYTVNFTTALSDANYAVVVTPGDSSGGYGGRVSGTPVSSSVRVNTSTSTLVDSSVTSVAVFR